MKRKKVEKEMKRKKVENEMKWKKVVEMKSKGLHHLFSTTYPANKNVKFVYFQTILLTGISS